MYAAPRGPIPAGLQHRLLQLSGALFTHNKTRDSGDRAAAFSSAHQVVSHLPLQMLLYFNVFYFPFWWLSEVLMLELKLPLLAGYYQVLIIMGMVVITSTELLRLYLGYVGNLQEKVPELATFWLLTVFFQLPLLLFFQTDEEVVILPLERAVHLIFLLFLISETVMAFLALKAVTQKLTMKYHLSQFDDGTGHNGHRQTDFLMLGNRT
ncbi:transmembrane protein 17A [Erpetoichthys calabaricus]|uniref:transmembrane protein 17A n=1 Tax=Erpetoichthys calabaricus TaxID=27687 RepID=UPI00109FC5EC|nr:transmembrane protein 17A [Erpetoichthys calabaricus]